MKNLLSQLGATLHAVKTIFSAFTGIGRGKNHQQALEKRSFKHFVIAGVIALALLICGIATLVHLVASQSK